MDCAGMIVPYLRCPLKPGYRNGALLPVIDHSHIKKTMASIHNPSWTQRDIHVKIKSGPF